MAFFSLRKVGFCPLTNNKSKGVARDAGQNTKNSLSVPIGLFRTFICPVDSHILAR